jgi:hypothetical protein
MANFPYPMPAGPRPHLRRIVVRFDPQDVHPRITELCERERENHDRGEHEHIDFIPSPRR